MTGGPGCSSEVALFGENGPCAVNEAGTNTTTNPYSWNSNANLLYIDQPTGTGFSFGTGLDSNEKEGAATVCCKKMYGCVGVGVRVVWVYGLAASTPPRWCPTIVGECTAD